MDRASEADNVPVSISRLVDFTVFAYRSLVIGRLGVTAEWRGLDWVDEAACADHAAATSDLCGRCPAIAECLAAAVVSDDRAGWRGGLHRTDRERLWAGLERTYREVRDFELMRMDARRLSCGDGDPRLGDVIQKGHRS